MTATAPATGEILSPPGPVPAGTLQPSPATAMTTTTQPGMVVVTPSVSLLPSPREYEIMLELAERFIESGFLPTSITKPAQALAIMLTGRELGIPPMLALRQIHVIEGKPTIAAELQLGMFVRRGGTYRWVRTDDECAHIQLRSPNGMTGDFQYTIAEARNAELLAKKNWKRYPAAMLRARAASLGIRAIAPDVSMGMYDPDEVGADVSPAGEIEAWPEVSGAAKRSQTQQEPQKNGVTPGAEPDFGPVADDPVLPMRQMLPEAIPLSDPRCHIGVVLAFIEKATASPATTKRFAALIQKCYPLLPLKIAEAPLETLRKVREWLTLEADREAFFADTLRAIDIRLEDLTMESPEDPTSPTTRTPDPAPAASGAAGASPGGSASSAEGETRGPQAASDVDPDELYDLDDEP